MKKADIKKALCECLETEKSHQAGFNKNSKFMIKHNLIVPTGVTRPTGTSASVRVKINLWHPLNWIAVIVVFFIGLFDTIKNTFLAIKDSLCESWEVEIDKDIYNKYNKES